MTKPNSTKFPCRWKPYPFQRQLWDYLQRGGKRAIVVWHRRAGKDLLALHWIVTAALKTVGVYWYVFTTYEQAKLTIWDGVTLDGHSYMSYIPRGLIKSARETDNRIELINGSIIKLVGSEQPNRLRGAGIRGAVLSEYSFQNPVTHFSVIQPMITRSNGWLLYLYTPSDDNRRAHGENLYTGALDKEGYFTQLLTIEDTTDHNNKALVTGKQIEDLRSTGMSEASIQREFYCDFEAFKYEKTQDNTFSEALRMAEADGRIGYVPYDTKLKVDTYWDLGIIDYTAIWFVQETEKSINFIDFFIANNKAIDFYIHTLKRLPYSYGRHILPHDVNRRQVATLTTQLFQMNEIAARYAFPPFDVGVATPREVLIEKARELLKTCRFDAKKCRWGLEYLNDFNARQRKSHSNSSIAIDTADAFCYAAAGARPNRKEYDLDWEMKLRRPEYRNSIREYDIWAV